MCKIQYVILLLTSEDTYLMHSVNCIYFDMRPNLVSVKMKGDGPQSLPSKMMSIISLYLG